LKARAVDEEKQRRRAREAEAYAAYVEHRRAVAEAAPRPPPIAQSAPGVGVEDLETVVIGIGREVKKQLAARDAQIAELERANLNYGLALEVGLAGVEQRLDEIQAKPGMKYEGVWNSEKAYSAGDFVTDKGSLFICKDGCINVRPGTSNAWQLAVQRGRDGRDRR
jgi:hypothetical protein